MLTNRFLHTRPEFPWTQPGLGNVVLYEGFLGCILPYVFSIDNNVNISSPCSKSVHTKFTKPVIFLRGHLSPLIWSKNILFLPNSARHYLLRSWYIMSSHRIVQLIFLHKVHKAKPAQYLPGNRISYWSIFNLNRHKFISLVYTTKSNIRIMMIDSWGQHGSNVKSIVSPKKAGRMLMRI